MKNLKIGLAQCCQTAGFDENAGTIFRFIDLAAAAGVQILCFPEAQTVGYRVDITPADAPVEPERLEMLHRQVARRCGQAGMACILGTETPLESDSKRGRPYNSALVISPEGKIIGRNHKTLLTPLDAVAYSPGPRVGVYELFGVKIGVVICFEGFRFGRTTQECVRRGAQLVFHPQNNTTRPNDWKIPVHHAMIVTRAAENTVWFASCNMCHRDYQNCASMIVRPDGRILAQAPLKEETLLTGVLDIELATRAMFSFDREGMAEVLFGETVKPEEYATQGAGRTGQGT